MRISRFGKEQPLAAAGCTEIIERGGRSGSGAMSRTWAPSVDPPLDLPVDPPVDPPMNLWVTG